MKRPQAEPTFPSLFDIRAAEVEGELAIARCQFCNAEDKELVDMRLPPLHLLKWTQREPPAAAGVRRRASAVAALRTHRVRAATEQT